MCGRYTLIADAEMLSIEFELLDVGPFLSRRYNIAPTQHATVVRIFEDRRQLATMRWSFVPSWSDQPKPGAPLINARSETVATSPAFRAAFRRRRCIVPCSGFYEWKSPTSTDRAEKSQTPVADSATAAPASEPIQGSLFDAPSDAQNLETNSSRRNKVNNKAKKLPPPRKQPYLIRPPDGGLLALAGIWESWQSRGGEVLETFAILTTAPNRVMAGLHNRMPVILNRCDYDRWLDPGVESPAQLADLLKACPDEKLELLAVSDRVNSVRFDDAACIAPGSG